MSHAVHTTRALVLGSAEVQDADKLFWLLTEDLGLLFASARGVRKEASKLRYSLADLAQTRVSLVRGKGLWRVTGAETYEGEEVPKEYRETFGRVATLVRRVMPTDEENPTLFKIITNTRGEFLKGVTDAETVERVSVARVLYQLGYISCVDAYKGLIDTEDFTADVLEKGAKLGQELINDINNGLNESHL